MGVSGSFFRVLGEDGVLVGEREVGRGSGRRSMIFEFGRRYT